MSNWAGVHNKVAGKHSLSLIFILTVQKNTSHHLLLTNTHGNFALCIAEVQADLKSWDQVNRTVKSSVCIMKSINQRDLNLQAGSQTQANKDLRIIRSNVLLTKTDMKHQHDTPAIHEHEPSSCIFFLNCSHSISSLRNAHLDVWSVHLGLLWLRSLASFWLQGSMKKQVLCSEGENGKESVPEAERRSDSESCWGLFVRPQGRPCD